MEKIVEQTLLYDFYGELLTEHQKSVYEDYVYNNIGLSEIALERGISRQSVHDLVKRCDKILESYEEKLQLIKKFNNTKKLVSDIKSYTKEYHITKDEKYVEKIEEITTDILLNIL